MKERLKIVQLRGTVFLPQSIGYTPDTAKEFLDMLLPGGRIFGVPQVPVLAVGPTIPQPQYGMPWRIFKRESSDSCYNIVFLPNKIDINWEGDGDYNSDLEQRFCARCSEWFAAIVNKLGGGTMVARIAYAPLYVRVEDEDFRPEMFWKKLMNPVAYEGAPIQDRSLSFLLKRVESFGEIPIQLNLLHNLFDGTRTVNRGAQLPPEVWSTCMIQLDINSVPERVLNLNDSGIKAFFSGVLSITNKLIDNLLN